MESRLSLYRPGSSPASVFPDPLHPPLLWRLRGPLDLPALERALAAWIAGQPTLRGPLLLEAEELADRRPEAVIEQWLQQACITPGEGCAEAPLRGRLLVVEAREHLLLLHPSPTAASSATGESVTFSLAPDRLAPFEDRCRREGATLGQVRVPAVSLEGLEEWEIEPLSCVVVCGTDALAAEPDDPLNEWPECLLPALVQESDQPVDRRHDRSSIGSLQMACALAERARDQVPAYRRLYEQGGWDGNSEFTELPITDKAGFLLSTPSPDLLASAKDSHFTYFRSSGASGRPFLWPQLKDDYRWSARRMREFLETTYGIHERRTLAVIGLALGSWVGGDQYSWVLKNVALDASYAMAVISPGNSHDEIIDLIADQQHDWDQILLVICPSHIGHLCLRAESRGQSLPLNRLRFLVVGEVFPESFRRELQHAAGIPADQPYMVSLYGSADTGSLAVESLASIAMRRLLEDHPDLAERLGFRRPIPSLLHGIASDAFYETIGEELCITRWQAIPLIRYNLHDRVRLLDWDSLREAILHNPSPFQGNAAELKLLDAGQGLPDLLAVLGRSDDALLLGGTTITGAMLEEVLRRPGLSSVLSGVFTAQTPFEKDGQWLEIVLELRPGLEPDPELETSIRLELVQGLCAINPEFASDWEAVYRAGFTEPSRSFLRLRTTIWPSLSDKDSSKIKRSPLPSHP